MSDARRIVVVDDEDGLRAGLVAVLERAGFVVEAFSSAETALARLLQGRVDALVTDLRLPGLSGLDLVRQLREAGDATPAVVITAHGTVEDAVGAMKLGARDFLTKPFSPTDLVQVVTSVLQDARDTPADAVDFRERRAASTTPSRRTLIATDPAMCRVLEIVDTVASSRAAVLIQGESGTGKELLARRLHEQGTRRHRPFVAVNCAALPRELLESELFGHERGAFTGAIARKIGKFEQAQGGTLLLDEVSEMEPGLQAKLLRVLQEYEVDRVGGSAPIPIDVRVVATSNRRLRDAVARGTFREDLFYRLNVVTVVVPPLRERPADVLPLAEHLLARVSDGRGLTFSDAAKAAIVARPWPGNVRELEHAIERAAALVPGRDIQPEHLAEPDAPPAVLHMARTLAGMTVREVERQVILDTLAQTGGNRTQAARSLDISIRTLRNKLAEYRTRGELPPSLGMEA